MEIKRNGESVDRNRENVKDIIKYLEASIEKNIENIQRYRKDIEKLSRFNDSPIGKKIRSFCEENKNAFDYDEGKLKEIESMIKDSGFDLEIVMDCPENRRKMWLWWADGHRFQLFEELESLSDRSYLFDNFNIDVDIAVLNERIEDTEEEIETCRKRLELFKRALSEPQCYSISLSEIKNNDFLEEKHIVIIEDGVDYNGCYCPNIYSVKELHITTDGKISEKLVDLLSKLNKYNVTYVLYY